MSRLVLFWSTFSHIRTEYGEMRSISPYSVQVGENIDQNNSEHGHFSRSANVKILSLFSRELESFGNSGNQPRRTTIYLKCSRYYHTTFSYYIQQWLHVHILNSKEMRFLKPIKKQ